MNYNQCRNCTAIKAAAYCGISFIVNQCENDCECSRRKSHVGRRNDKELRSLQLSSVLDVFSNNNERKE